MPRRSARSSQPTRISSSRPANGGTDATSSSRDACIFERTGGTRTIVLETIRFPTRDVALADGRYEITGGTGGDRRMWSAFVMVRESDAWRIAAIRNMLPAPPAQ